MAFEGACGEGYRPGDRAAVVFLDRTYLGTLWEVPARIGGLRRWKLVSGSLVGGVGKGIWCIVVA